MLLLPKEETLGKWFLHVRSADPKEVFCSRNFPQYFHHLKVTHGVDVFKHYL